MKSLKKIIALVIAMVMVLGMSAIAWADVPTSQTIASDSAADANGKYQISVASTDTHTYTVYQILKGTLIAGESKLGNPVWGADAAKTGNTGVDDFITAVTAANGNVAINDLVNAELKSGATGCGTVTASSPCDVEPGYYLIVDTTTGLADGDAKSLNIVAVFNDITITPKKGTVEREKHVDDQNDSDSTDKSVLKDSADYDIGDSIPYTLTMKLPDDYANYKQYKIVFTDDMSAGLTYDGNAKIYYGDDTTGTSITFVEGGTSEYTTPSAGKVYTYTITDLKAAQKADGASDALKGLVAGSVIKITYTATLNSNAVIGSAGNPNKYKVDFSSNPNQAAGGTPETNDTPWDVNIVFTYKTVFNKVDGSSNPLEGADFTLEKKVGSNWVNVTALHTGTGAVNPTKTGDKNGTTFTFAGLDAGDYKLTETDTPAGYNTIDPIEFRITATHELEADTPVLQTLTGDGGATFTMTADKTAGSLTADVINSQGAILPSTGGIGTTIFYVVGAILVLGAGVLLITRRRVNAQ